MELRGVFDILFEKVGKQILIKNLLGILVLKNILSKVFMKLQTLTKHQSGLILFCTKCKSKLSFFFAYLIETSHVYFSKQEKRK